MSTAVSALPRTAQGSGFVVYWHLLSLDAPCVAALWTVFLAHQFQTHVPFAAPVALGLAVWVLYVADRVHDAAQGDVLQARHRFHLKHARLLLFGAFAGGCALLALLVELPTGLRAAWMLLAVPLAVYVCAVHVLQRRVPKEPLVALFFAAATAMPVYVARGVAVPGLQLVALSFGVVCWLNCAAIARWEGMLRSADPLTRWLGTHLEVGAGLAALLVLPALLLRESVPIAIALLAAAMGLLQLHRERAHLSAEMLRALADAVLLTPVVVWPMCTWLNLR